MRVKDLKSLLECVDPEMDVVVGERELDETEISYHRTFSPAVATYLLYVKTDHPVFCIMVSSVLWSLEGLATLVNMQGNVQITPDR